MVKKHTKFLKKGMALFFINIFGVAFSIVLNVVLAKEMTQVDYGFYAYIISLFTLLSIACQFGFPTFIIKNLTLYYNDKSYELFNGLVIFSFTFVMSLSLLISLVLFIFKTEVSALLSLESNIQSTGLLLIPIISSLILTSAFLRAMEQPIRAMYPQVLMKPLLTLLIIVFFLYTQQNISIEIAINSYLISSIICFVILSCSFIYLLLDVYKTTKTIEFKRKTWLMGSAPLLLLSSAAVINDNLPVILLNQVLDLESVALYRMSSLGGAVVNFVLLSLTIVIMPRLSVFFENDEYDKIEDLSKVCAKLGMLLSFPFLVAYYYMSKDFIVQILGQNYSDIHIALSLYAFSRILMAGFGIPGAVLIMSGYGPKVGRYWLITVLISASVGVFSANKYGFIGMIACILIGELLLNLKLRQVVANVMSINTGIYPISGLKRSNAL